MPVTERLPATLGPYRLEQRLGAGGMGVVHLARTADGTPVAIKVLRPTEDVRRLIREAESMRRVRSPFVAEVLDASVQGEFPYIVTRYVQGPTLDALVRRNGPLSAPGTRRLAVGLAEALTAIHAAGIVHRDLKPGNVMMTDDRPVVIDFGIAQAPEATRLTQTGMVMGTPGYLAPEVIEGQPSSPASDVFAWGATVAFAATGRSPFGEGSFETIFFRIVSGQADLAGVPAELGPLLQLALDRNPMSRPPAALLRMQAASGTVLAPAPLPTQYPAKAVTRAQPPPLLPPGPIGRAAIPSQTPPRPAAAARPAPADPRYLPGLAFAVASAALTFVLPVAGLLAALGLVTLLRAADMAHSRPALAPVAVARALLTTVLLAPLAAAAGTVAWAATIVTTHQVSTVRAPALAAAAFVTVYWIGPGSRRPRRQLRRILGALARTPASVLAAAIAAWALAAAAVTFAWSQSPYFWPAMLPQHFGHIALTTPRLPKFPGLPHVPSLRHLFTSAANWLSHHVHP